jgi:Cu/Ag efflux protein CusF
MNKLMITAGAAAILAVSSLAALAAEANGAIASIDPAAGSVTLADGKTYFLPASVAAASLKIGQQVTITYEEQNGKMNASVVKPAT